MLLVLLATVTTGEVAGDLAAQCPPLPANPPTDTLLDNLFGFLQAAGALVAAGVAFQANRLTRAVLLSGLLKDAKLTWQDATLTPESAKARISAMTEAVFPGNKARLKQVLNYVQNSP